MSKKLRKTCRINFVCTLEEHSDIVIGALASKMNVSQFLITAAQNYLTPEQRPVDLYGLADLQMVITSIAEHENITPAEVVSNAVRDYMWKPKIVYSMLDHPGTRLMDKGEPKKLRTERLIAAVPVWLKLMVAERAHRVGMTESEFVRQLVSYSLVRVDDSVFTKKPKMPRMQNLEPGRIK